MLFLTVLFGCAQSGGITIADPPTEDDGTESVHFDLDRIHSVSIELDPDDWDALRAESRDLFGTLAGDCLDRTFETPFTWFEADVQVDDQEAEQVGIRKKGFLGSLSEDKPSLKLKLDKFVDGQDWGDTERITLNNQLQDASLVRACLGYQVFEEMGVASPRCNFAHVTVNGEDMGVYAHVEAVKRDFLERAFGDSGGHLYEGTLSDFREGYTSTFDPKTSDTDPDAAPLQPIVDALDGPDDGLVERLEPYVDLDQFITFWSAEILTAHWDGYAMNTNNFYVYVDPADGLARFVPWGVDAVFVEPEEAGEGMPLVTTGELARRLYANPDMRSRLETELERQLSVYDEDALLDDIDTMEGVIAPYAADAAEVAAALDVLREVVLSRRDAVEELLATLPPDAPPPTDPVCLEPVGTVDWTFDTLFSPTLELPTFADAVDLDLEGQLSTFAEPISVAGYGETGEALVTTLGNPAPGQFAQVVVSTEPERFQTGILAVDLIEAEGYVVIIDEATEEQLFVGLLQGDLVLDAADTTSGSAVTGSFSGSVFSIGP